MRHCFVAAILLSLSSLAFSQGFGTIVGTVTDPSGALVVAAKVTVVESGTGISREAVTNTSGGFVIPGLRPTNYTLTVEVPPWKLDGRDFGHGATLRAPVHLDASSTQ